LTDVPTSFTASAHTHTESDITWTNHTLFPIGDDIYIGDVNLGGHLGLKSKKATYNTGLIFIKQNTDNDTTPSTTGGKITWDGTKFIITSTTPIDASISGNATTATSATSATTATTASKLGSSNVGSARQAIYLSGGTATAGNYTVAHLGNAGKSNMNDIGRLHASTGMT